MLPHSEAAQIALAQAGDVAAREAIIEQYLPLVFFVRKQRYGNPPAHIDPEDLISAGMLGLIEAVDHFDIAFGVLFVTFATGSIHRRMSRWVRHEDPVAPVLWERERVLRAAERRLTDAGLPVTEDGMERELKMTATKLARLRQLATRPQRLSLDDPVGHGTEMTPGECVVAGDDTESEVLQHVDAAFIRAVIDSLPKDQKELILQRHFLGMKNVEIARLKGRSREGIRKQGNAADKALKERLIAAGWVA